LTIIKRKKQNPKTRCVHTNQSDFLSGHKKGATKLVKKSNHEQFEFFGRSLRRLGKKIKHFTAQKICISGQVAAHLGNQQVEVDMIVWQWECRHDNVDSFYFICEISPKKEIQNSKISDFKGFQLPEVRGKK
jgi:hypothetical protein